LLEKINCTRGFRFLDDIGRPLFFT